MRPGSTFTMHSVFDIQHQHDNVPAKIIAGLDRISQALRFLMWERGKEYGLTPIQMQCLIFVRYHKGEQNRAGKLAKEFDVTAATISQAIKTLIGKGYIKRETLESDARVQTLQLTQEGLTICNDIDDWANGILAKLKDSNSQKLTDALQFILAFIQSLQEEGMISVARQCTTCLYFANDPANETGLYCELLRKQLKTADLRIDCPEHEQKS